MKSRVIAVGALLVVVVVIAWNALFFGPAGEDVTKAKARNTAAVQSQAQLDAQLKSLEDIVKRGPEFQAQLEKLSSAVPKKVDLEGFLRSAYAIKVASGVDWVSIQPSTPALGASGTSEVSMQISINGGFYQVLDYLNRFEALRRLVVIDGINITTGAAPATGGSSGGSTPTTSNNSGKAPNLTISLNARMFTQADAPGTAGSGTGTSGAPAAPGGTSNTQKPFTVGSSVPTGGTK